MVQETLEITDKQLVRRFRTQLRRNVPRNGATEGPNQREKNSRWRNLEGNGTLRLRLLVQPRPRRQASHQRIRQRQTLNPRRPFRHVQAKPGRKGGSGTTSRHDRAVDNVKVVAELPGVEKSDIALECDGRNLVLKVDTDKHRYYKSLELPVAVDPDTSKASYKNGVLELILRRKSPGNKAKQIQIE